ncbi:MAG: 2-C-methyl-D-erythritol 4-phosphate cytidylyltransferase [Acidiferrobacterales bacterium]
MSRGLWALVPAAGRGRRMGGECPKQYLRLRDSTVLQHTLERLDGFAPLQGIFVGIAPDDSYWPALSLRIPGLLGSFPGGGERAHTVLNGLQVLAASAQDQDWVMVHDAVRPCVRHSDLRRLVDAVGDHPDGGLLGLPLADTVKRADDKNRVMATVPRHGLWRALTPQIFPIGVLRDALERALADGVEVTDEASAVEHAGGKPRMVAGHADNIKITMPGDLALAELYLERQAAEAD